jgi:hypothetical protein
MGQTSNTNIGGLDALTAGNASSAKTVVPNVLGTGCTLAANTDYYFSLDGMSDAMLQHLTLKWDASIIVTWSVECTSIPAKKRNDDSDDLKAWDNTAGNGWNQEPMTSSSFSVVDTTGATGSATAGTNSIVVAGSTAGSASLHIGNLGSRRTRIKASVKGTGGVVRVCAAGKD